jgi:phosphotransferase system enzyme I (PtsP)
MRDHVELLHDIGELQGIITDSPDLDILLGRICKMVAVSLGADVCSVYVFDRESEELTLRSTYGLSPDSTGVVRMKLGDGLTGLALKELRSIRVDVASQHPNYRFFPGIGEEAFESFIAVPVTRGLVRIGAITAQRDVAHHFDDRDVMALKVVAAQLASMMENIRLLSVMSSVAGDAPPTRIVPPLDVIHGRVGSGGFALGPATVLGSTQTLESLCAEADGAFGIADFKRAVRATEEQVMRMEAEVEKALSGDASLIFSSHLLVLKDPHFGGRMEKLIESGSAVGKTVLAVTRSLTQKFRTSTNTYLQEKASDVEDLAVRLMRNVIGGEEDPSSLKGTIVIAQELVPSDIVRFASQGVGGVILMSGGVTSHLAILARSVRLPLVLADEPRLALLPPKTTVLIDADEGMAYVDPSEEVIRGVKEAVANRDRTCEAPAEGMCESTTIDGVRIAVLANINLLAELETAECAGAEGIGLYRTEFPYLVRNRFVTEQEQVSIYARLVAKFEGKPITIRTLDIGGDKMMRVTDDAVKEENPFLGLRSIRFSLAHRDVFEQQVRAIMRAAEGADVKIMLPMISSVEEFEEARGIIRSCAEQLAASGEEYKHDIPVGVLVELPSAVALIDELCDVADFISIGTNDLIQYTLGVDRTNARVSTLYVAHHPAVLRSIARVAEAAARSGVDLAVCGDMAGDPRYIPFLLGVGIRCLSVAPEAMALVREKIASTNSVEATVAARAALTASRAAESAEALGIR